MHSLLFLNLCARMHCQSPAIHFSPSASCHVGVPSRVIGRVILILVGFKLQFCWVCPYALKEEGLNWIYGWRRGYVNAAADADDKLWFIFEHRHLWLTASGTSTEGPFQIYTKKLRLHRVRCKIEVERSQNFHAGLLILLDYCQSWPEIMFD